MSWGLPLLYTKGQGVDGLLPPSAGIAVNPYSVDDIADGLATLLTTDSMGNQEMDFEQFRWSKIVEKYMTQYNDLDARHKIEPACLTLDNM